MSGRYKAVSVVWQWKKQNKQAQIHSFGPRSWDVRGTVKVLVTATPWRGGEAAAVRVRLAEALPRTPFPQPAPPASAGGLVLERALTSGPSLVSRTRGKLSCAFSALFRRYLAAGACAPGG